MFRYQGTPIAFFLNVWGADENYILLEWGIDRDFEHYRKANLYRAALMLSLKDAISRDKRRMEMGITNYFTKLRIPGARVIPTIYFLRHSTDPVHTATLARMMMHNIQRPTLITVRRGAIPTTTSGKLKRRAVAQAYRDGTLPRLATHAWTADPDSAPKTTRSSLEGAH